MAVLNIQVRSNRISFLVNSSILQKKVVSVYFFGIYMNKESISSSGYLYS